MAYRPDLILLVDFDEGKYSKGRKNPLSVNQIPLMRFRGLSYLGKNLMSFDGSPEYDKNQIRHVIKAFAKFPVKIKCYGGSKKCSGVAEKIVIPWEMVHKHDEQVGPELRKQFYVDQSQFCCINCYNDKKYREVENDKLAGLTALPISFGIAVAGKKRFGTNLDRTELHRKLKKIAYQLISQDTGEIIDPYEMKELSRISKKGAKEIVNKLLGIQRPPKEPEQGELFDLERKKVKRKEIEYKERPIFILKRAPQKNKGQLMIETNL